MNFLPGGDELHYVFDCPRFGAIRPFCKWPRHGALMPCRWNRVGLLNLPSPGISAAALCAEPGHWGMKGILFLTAPILPTFVASFRCPASSSVGQTGVHWGGPPHASGHQVFVFQWHSLDEGGWHGWRAPDSANGCSSRLPSQPHSLWSVL